MELHREKIIVKVIYAQALTSSISKSVNGFSIQNGSKTDGMSKKTDLVPHLS